MKNDTGQDVGKVMTPDIIVRGRTQGDVSRLFRDWLMSYRHAGPVRAIPNPVYFHWHHRLIESAMVDPTVAWLVAVSASDPTFIYGWLCGQEDVSGQLVVHYVHVAQRFRRLGLGGRLLSTLGVQRDQGVVVTHLTHVGRMLLEARGNAVLFNPYLFLGRAPIPAPAAVKVDRATALTMEHSRSTMALGHDLNEQLPEDEAT